MADEQLTDQDREDLNMLGLDPDGEVDHTLLEIWRNVLGNIESQKSERIHPQTAQKVVSAWPKLSFQDTPLYHERYFAILKEFRDILDFVIQEHPGCLKNVGGDENDDGSHID